MVILGIDPGLTGGIARLKDGSLIDVQRMPVVKVVVQEKLTQLDLDSKGKKQFIKSGPNKGLPKTKVRRPEKSENILDIHAIQIEMETSGAQLIVIERQHPRPGGSSASCAKTMLNQGRLLCLAELSGIRTIIVEPSVWKKHFSITLSKSDRKEMPKQEQTKKLKQLACLYAEHLSGKSFKTARDAIMDGEAEAYLISKWAQETIKEKNDQ